MPDGFFFKLRQGEHEAGRANDLAALLRSIDVEDASGLPRKLAALLWVIPIFMEWQIARVVENGGDAESLKRDQTLLQETLTELLGAP